MRSRIGAESNFGIVVMAGPFEAALAGAEAGVEAAGAGGSDFEQATESRRTADAARSRFMVFLNKVNSQPPTSNSQNESLREDSFWELGVEVGNWRR
jgi:hypothetical protein